MEQGLDLDVLMQLLVSLRNKWDDIDMLLKATQDLSIMVKGCSICDRRLPLAFAVAYLRERADIVADDARDGLNLSRSRIALTVDPICECSQGPAIQTILH